VLNVYISAVRGYRNTVTWTNESIHLKSQTVCTSWRKNIGTRLKS